MRLKQLLGTMLLLLLCVTVAAAAGAQLTGVKASSQGNATTLNIGATGTFTHTEYRPAENLLLVDLAGVSAGKLNGTSQSLNLPGVESYRVLGYRGASGADVARVELSLASDAQVEVQEAGGGLQVKVTSRQPAQPRQAAGKRSGAPVKVQHVGVVRSAAGLDIEIRTSGPVTPTSMRLSNPERIVIDLPNAIPARSREIAVHEGAVKSVRMARFQAQPPVTRVVVDLEESRKYDVVAAGNKVLVKLRAEEAQPAAQPAAEVVESAATPPPASEPAAEAPAPAATQSAQEFVMVEPTYSAKTAEEKPAGEASGFTPPAPEAALSNLMPATSASMRSLPVPAVNLPREQAQQQQAAQAPPGPRYTGEPISVNLKDVDLRDFFRLIHEISGLNVVLDPNVKGTLTIVLEDVPWDQALDIVLKNHGLDKQVEGNVLRIATVKTIQNEAEAQRAKAEAQALAVPKITVTRYLSYAKARDATPIIKKFLSQRGDVVSDDRVNALIIQDIPSVFPDVDRLIGQLDRKTQEVEIEARVVAATRSFARDLGTQLGFGWGNRVTAVGGGVGDSPISHTVPAPRFITSSNDSIPLFSNMRVPGATSGIAFTNATNAYRLDFILTMAESRGLLKILSRPRVVTQNNIVASVRQGLRIPIVTQAQLGGPPTVSYVNALLQLTVTPQITVENTIFLNVDVENTVPDFSRTINDNPTLITQQATTSVLVSDGGTVVIGGVIQTQNSVNVQQVPLLGEIPILGNLFKRRTVSTSTQELLFFITPKIIQT